LTGAATLRGIALTISAPDAATGSCKLLGLFLINCAKSSLLFENDKPGPALAGDVLANKAAALAMPLRSWRVLSSEFKAKMGCSTV